MIDVRKLRMLAELDRLGTVAAVAEELRLTAPGVSMQLAALERELDVTLTERQGRRLALTPAGRLLAAHGRDLVDRLSLAEFDVDALRRGVQGTYRLAAFPSAARTLVADAWRALREEHADIGLRLSTPEPEAALAALTAGEADLALVHAYSTVPRRLPDGVVADLIAEEPVWLALRADDPLAADTVDLTALADRDWAMPTRDLSCFDMVERACGLAGFRPRLVAETLDFAVQLELVAAGIGVALVPDLTVAAVPAGVRLVRPSVPVTRSTHAVRRIARRNDPGLDRILQALVDAAARIRTAPPA
ncbi:LysR family transcriptional regulator [Microbacterium azadirachtae]|uniref:LysR family transcriptional regulator n=1 Tax=Microbacterium azadirachtae TaxID=582680 RepID=UPI000885F3B5|nr:LysR family transcriptional regulator [Microbacterium azadirachtae]UXW85861.1 LysR family transcriptional regulator [Microbacterium azadirachtae]SDL70247.1 DNA-binding transcriptional regulator, LysR family [Microbacterium azadirachtae]SEF99933.1 DNA-binding transcriptional regulator, LysR family [Microbacterium azadirachtae]SEG02163.1 DNA-binding transcriptional regulator, LysR family [Microbacterium azadirachtae]